MEGTCGNYDLSNVDLLRVINYVVQVMFIYLRRVLQMSAVLPLLLVPWTATFVCNLRSHDIVWTPPSCALPRQGVRIASMSFSVL